MFADNNPEDLEKTTKMKDEVSKPAEKKPGDWVTAPMPSAAKPQAAQQAAPQPKPSSPPPVAQVSPAASAPPVSSYEASPTPPSTGGGMGSFLSKFGINDPKTQQWVLIGGGIGLLLMLCCICSCGGYVLWNNILPEYLFPLR